MELDVEHNVLETLGSRFRCRTDALSAPDDLTKPCDQFKKNRKISISRDFPVPRAAALARLAAPPLVRR